MRKEFEDFALRRRGSPRLDRRRPGSQLDVAAYRGQADELGDFWTQSRARIRSRHSLLWWAVIRQPIPALVHPGRQA
jgi:hypothetical protein